MPTCVGSSSHGGKCGGDFDRTAVAGRGGVQPNLRGLERAPDDLYDEVAEHYDDEAIATLMAVLGSARFWTTIAMVAQKPPAGSEAAA